MLIELKTFVEYLDCDCYFITHHTVSASLSGPNFLERKDEIVKTLNNEIKHGDMDRYAEIRRNKRSL